jgi:hypothetical protein
VGADRARRKLRGGSLNIEWEKMTRQKIQAAGVVNRLIDHVNGKNKLEQTQVSAALGLLRKVLPDLVNAQVFTETAHRFAVVPQVMSKEDWLRSRGDPNLLAQLKREDQARLEASKPVLDLVAAPDDEHKLNRAVAE